MDVLLEVGLSLVASLILLVLLFPPVREIRYKRTYVKWKRWKSIYLLIYMFLFLFFSFMVFFEGANNKDLIPIFGSFILIVVAMVISYEDVENQENKEYPLLLIIPSLILSLFVWNLNPLLAVLYFISSYLLATHPKIKYLNPIIMGLTYKIYNINIRVYSLITLIILLALFSKIVLNPIFIIMATLLLLFLFLYFKDNLERLLSRKALIPKMVDLEFPPSVYAYFFLSLTEPSVVFGDLIFLKSKGIIDVVVSKKYTKKFRVIKIKEVKDPILSYLLDIIEKRQDDDGYVDAVEFSTLGNLYMSMLKLKTRKLRDLYFDSKKISAMENLLGAILVSLLLSNLLLNISPHFVPALLGIFFLVILLYSFVRSTPLKFNKKGYEVYLKLKAYIEWLRDNTRIKELSFTAVELWDEHFAYATAFGVARKALEELSLPQFLYSNENVEKAYLYFKKELEHNS